MSVIRRAAAWPGPGPPQAASANDRNLGHCVSRDSARGSESESEASALRRRATRRNRRNLRGLNYDRGGLALAVACRQCCEHTATPVQRSSLVSVTVSGTSSVQDTSSLPSLASGRLVPTSVHHPTVSGRKAVCLVAIECREFAVHIAWYPIAGFRLSLLCACYY